MTGRDCTIISPYEKGMLNYLINCLNDPYIDPWNNPMLIFSPPNDIEALNDKIKALSLIMVEHKQVNISSIEKDFSLKDFTNKQKLPYKFGWKEIITFDNNNNNLKILNYPNGSIFCTYTK